MVAITEIMCVCDRNKQDRHVCSVTKKEHRGTIYMRLNIIAVAKEFSATKNQKRDTCSVTKQNPKVRAWMRAHVCESTHLPWNSCWGHILLLESKQGIPALPIC
jgi:hypothetical protein